MLKNLKFPLIYVMEFILFLPLIAGFGITAAFLAAKPITDLDLHGKSLPQHWDAAIPSHGKFIQGFLIADHLQVFVAGIALLVASATALFLVHKSQIHQRQHDGSSAAAHMTASICVGLALLALGYFLLNHVLIGVAPA